MAKAQPGDFWRRILYGVTVYGYAMTTEEVIAQEMALGASADEAEWTAARLQERYVKKGLLWGRAASEAYPQGEYGSTPASDTVRITQEEYEAAELREWKS